MTKNILKSTISKVLVTGIAVAACVGGAALPASAATTDSSSSDQVRLADMGYYIAGGNFHTSQDVELGSGTKLTSWSRGYASFDLREVDNKPTEMVVSWDWSARNVNAAAYYPIKQNGQSTDYYIQPTITSSDENYYPTARCDVYLGMPGDGGKKLDPTTGAFGCVTNQRGSDNDWDFTVFSSAN